jgi:hypothetical protein
VKKQLGCHTPSAGSSPFVEIDPLNVLTDRVRQLEAEVADFEHYRDETEREKARLRELLRCTIEPLRVLGDVDLADEIEELCPGCVKDEPAAKPPLGYVSAADVMKLPAEEREALLANAARLAQDEYETNPDLTDFEAYGEEDLRDETPPDDE